MSSSLYVTFDKSVDPEYSAVNIKGEIVAKILGKDTFKIFDRSGKSRKLCDVPRKEDAGEWKVCAMDVDEEDNIYVITAFQERDDKTWRFNLFTFHASENKKLECPLDFVQKRCWPEVSMTVKNKRKIAISDYENKMVYIGNVCGVELNPYVEETRLHVKDVRKIRFSYFNGLKIIVLGLRAIYIYAENEIEREIEIPSTLSQSLAINHVTHRIITKTRFSLLEFSESGELRKSLGLGYAYPWMCDAVLTSHLNGPVVLVGYKQAAYIEVP